jgi:hypothetical protein
LKLCRRLANLRTALERGQLANPKPGLKSKMSLNDLEFAYAPVRNQVRDLREYL